MKFNTPLDIFITFIISIKVIFTILSSIYFFDEIKNKEQGKESSEFDDNIFYWKDRCEFIFIASVAILLIYYFNPTNNKPIVIDFETKLLFFIFGWIIFVKADWKLFFGDSKILSYIQKIF